MKIETIFFLCFAVLIAIAFMLEPYVVEEQKPSDELELEFKDFVLTQTDTQGFKSLLSGKSAKKYPQLLLIQEAVAIDEDGNELQGLEARVIGDMVYLEEDVIISTLEAGVFYTQSAQYNSKTQEFESTAPFEAHYGEHRFYGKQLWYSDGVIDADDVRAILN